MHIGIVIPGFSGSADERAIPVQDALVERLSAAADVRVLALRYPHRRDRYELRGAHVTALGWRQVRGVRRLALWADAAHTLVRLHRERRFDVLHAMWADETGALAAWAGRALNVPVVVSLLGGELARLDDIGYGLGRGAFSRWTVGQALGGAHGIVAAGAYARAALGRAGYGAAADRVRVIPLGVDTVQFARERQKFLNAKTQRRRDAKRSWHLICAASLVPVKDHATLLHAVALLPDVTLELVGDGTERAALMRLADTLGIGDRVRFAGALPHHAMPTAYHRAALHVLASRSEALPIAVLEAAASGVYSVTTAVGALPDYPALAATVPVRDSAALAAAIRAHLPNAAALGIQARQAARDHFSIDGTAARLLALYRELLSR